MRVFTGRAVRVVVGALALAATSLTIGGARPALAANIDLEVTIVYSGSTVTAGVQEYFSVRVKNNGPQTATGATVSMPLPSGLTATWECGSFFLSGTCNQGPVATTLLSDTMTIPSGETIAYTVSIDVPSNRTAGFSLTATATAGSADSPEANTADNSATKALTIKRVTDVYVTISDNTGIATPGGSTTYTIFALNAGPSDAVGASVAMSINPLLAPGVIAAVEAGQTWTCASATPGASCTAAGSGAFSDTLTLPAGASATYTVHTPTPPAAFDGAEEFSVAIFIFPPAGASQPGIQLPNFMPDTDHAPAGAGEADLAVTLTDGIPHVWVGAVPVYTMVVSNAGPTAVTGAALTSAFPVSVTWTCTGSGGATCPASAGAGAPAGAVTMPVNGSLTYTVSTGPVPVPPGATMNWWTATASITNPGGVPTGGDADNNSAKDADLFQYTADIVITNTDGAASKSEGDPVSYAITVTNPSPHPFPSIYATGKVDALLPPNLIGATWTCAGSQFSQCTASGTGDIHDTTLLVHPDGGSVTYTVTGTVGPTSSGTMTSTATVTLPDDFTEYRFPPVQDVPGLHDPNLVNNTASDTTTILKPDLVPDVSAPTSVLVGDDLAYSVTVANQGDGPAAAATVTLPTPAGTTFVSASQVTGPAATFSTPAVGSAGSTQAAIASLPAGASATFTFVVDVGDAVVPDTDITGIVSAATMMLESDVTDNTASTATTAAVVDYVPVVPDRVLETRPDGQTGYAGGRPAAGQIVELDVTGVGTSQVPDDAGAVVLNVTGTNAAAPGYVTVWPCGAPQPTASNLNLAPGVSSPNLVVSKIGTDGRVCLFTQTAADLIADVNGYMPIRARYVPLVPERLLETRATGQTGYVGGKPAAGSTIELQITGVGTANVPADAGAVVMNVTGTGADASGYVTVWPCGAPQPNASNLNLASGGTSPNLVVSKIGSGGKVCLFTQSSVDLIADVSGYMPAGSSYEPVVPERLLETRIDRQTGYVGGKPAAGSTIELQVTGAGATNVPASANAVVLNVTGVGADPAGFVTVWPCGSPQPNASNLNLTAGGISPNLVMAKVGAGGKVCIFTQSSADMIADVNGYWP